MALHAHATVRVASGSNLNVSAWFGFRTSIRYVPNFGPPADQQLHRPCFGFYSYTKPTLRTSVRSIHDSDGERRRRTFRPGFGILVVLRDDVFTARHDAIPHERWPSCERSTATVQHPKYHRGTFRLRIRALNRQKAACGLSCGPCCLQ